MLLFPDAIRAEYRAIFKNFIPRDNGLTVGAPGVLRMCFDVRLPHLQCACAVMPDGMTRKSAEKRENKYQRVLKDHRASTAGSAGFAHWHGS